MDSKPRNKYESRTFRQYSGVFLEGSLEVVAAWFAARLEEIPPAYRDNATCNIGAYSEYDSPYAEIEISYHRPETADETTLRVAQEQAVADNKRNAELRELARLKSKYGVKEQ